jgi:hypothetical protein
VRRSPETKDMNIEMEESTALGAITKQCLVKTQQTEKTKFDIKKCVSYSRACHYSE